MEFQDESENDLNVTQIFVMANSNIPIYTDVHFQDFRANCLRLFKGPLATEYRKFIFGSTSIAPKVQASQYGVEIGSKQHRGHVHIVYTIYHHASKYSVRKFATRLAKVLNKKGTFSNGWYVHAKLTPLQALNYANKEARRAGNAAFVRAMSEQDALELHRVNDPWLMVTVRGWGGKIVYQLAGLTI